MTDKIAGGLLPKVSPRTDRSHFLGDVSQEVVDEHAELMMEKDYGESSNEDLSGLDAESADDFGVNDENFNFRDYKFQGKVDLDDVEEPELMEDLFGSQMGINEKANLLIAGRDSASKSQLSDAFSLRMDGMEPEDPFTDKTIHLAEIELKDLKQQEAA